MNERSVSLPDTDFLSVDDVYAGEDVVEDVLSGRDVQDSREGAVNRV